MLLRLRAPSLLPVALLAVTTSAFAASPNPKLQAFQSAESALVAKIGSTSQQGSFLYLVNACNPPVAMVKNQIMTGFAGAQPESALNMLALELKNVNDHAAAAEAKLDPLEASAASCKGGKAQLSSAASSEGQQVKSDLGNDEQNLQLGIKAATDQEPNLRTALGLRQTLPLGTGDEASCEAAANMINDMKSEYAALDKALLALESDYSARVLKVASTVNACSGATPAMFHDVIFAPSEDGEAVAPAVPEVDGAADDASSAI